MFVKKLSLTDYYESWLIGVKKRRKLFLHHDQTTCAGPASLLIKVITCDRRQHQKTKESTIERLQPNQIHQPTTPNLDAPETPLTFKQSH